MKIKKRSRRRYILAFVNEIVDEFASEDEKEVQPRSKQSKLCKKARCTKCPRIKDSKTLCCCDMCLKPMCQSHMTNVCDDCLTRLCG